ncbi:recombinase family protein [Dehalococcoides mccartyi]|uniref:recombinase family protein n=1 Tax=Dehalococcoides mccartyi TaxID=61435 RepID=UPI000804AA2B|nr:recombinase family protein [Dehalococcoides mccartyi]OBW61021.1 MAG: serine recombinase [Dehalococcoides mccartyi]
MKVAIYQRRLKSDQGQIPSFQDLWDFALGQGWEIYNQYQDNVSIAGNSRRNAWQELLADAALSKFDLVLIPQIDEVFSSVMDMAKTLGKLKVLRIGLRSYSEPWFDTTSISGEALYRLSLSYAALEKDRHHRKLKSGLAHARKMGCQIGRPRVTQRQGFNQAYGDILERLRAGQISRRQAAKVLGIGYATLKRLLDSNYQGFRDF